jgi:hypothetical protein
MMEQTPFEPDTVARIGTGRKPSVTTMFEAEPMELNQRAASRSGRADDARRARLTFRWRRATRGRRYATSCTATMRSLTAGLDGSERKGWRGCSAGTPVKRRALSHRRSKLASWSGRSSAKPGWHDSVEHTQTRGQLGVSHMMVARVWAKHGLKPQRRDRYIATNDPDFETKSADIIGLYLNPPVHAAVFCVGEDSDPSPRPQRSGVAALPGPRGAARL